MDWSIFQFLLPAIAATLIIAGIHAYLGLHVVERGVIFAEHHLAQGSRVLIHCEHGIGRSAVLALCVLSRHGYEPLAALQLAKDRRWRVSPSPTQYEGWARWLRREGREPPDFDTFQRIAYRHLATT